jgi:hypothetical protein
MQGAALVSSECAIVSINAMELGVIGDVTPGNTATAVISVHCWIN